ncbi:aldehyde dehydrogenase (NAD) family protein [SAR86 cluster bacterium SAR86E]|uniref:aldehyde dehydrogenase (NAD(+)) n=1 Tax=SAR86 cluster bacterium SAR86E TaxID=1208365 RepID=K6GGB9_9GAMM|nr:aldehyde dehydrogenase (NAD) family protein [SAR86 cluster bacterium SAR86E]
MSDHLKFYINGEWEDSLGSETIEVFNPSDESVIGSISAGTKEDVDIAVASAKEAFKTFGFSTKEERIELLENIISEYEKRSDDLAQTISQEMGAPLWLSNVAQVTSGLSHFKDTLEVLKTYEFEGTENNYLIRKEPIGVIGMITPWNWPMNQMCTKVASAIASGCTMVLKPSEITPFCGIMFAEIIHAAGVPAGVFNLVNGMGPIVGAALSEHKDIDMMHFTGSTRAGVAVAIASAPTVKRVAQELGGKSANIILDDADIEKAAGAGANHCFMNTGQSCNAPTRMLVSATNYERAVEAAAQVANSTVVGAPEDEDVKIGPISNKVQYEKVQRLIQIGIDEGARLVAGGIGRPEGRSEGYFVKPTVFADVTNDMTIAREEIFGPVLSILKYESEDEAIEIANDTEYGLAGYVQSGDEDHAKQVARRIRAGQISINGGSRGPAAPFGGFKTSGNGREHGLSGLEECLETKAIIGS